MPKQAVYAQVSRQKNRPESIFMSIVHVIAILTAKPGQRSNVMTLFHELVPTVLAEQGCITYEAAVDTKNGTPTQSEYGPDTFVVIEKWANLTALRSHSASSHMEAFAERTQLMMAGRSVYILSPSEGRD